MKFECALCKLVYDHAKGKCPRCYPVPAEREKYKAREEDWKILFGQLINA